MLSGAPIKPDEDMRLRHIARSTFARDTPQERLACSIDSTDDASSSYDGASLYASKSATSASSLPLYPLVVAIITVFVVCSGLFIESIFHQTSLPRVAPSALTASRSWLLRGEPISS